jgi:hypothetical protein
MEEKINLLSLIPSGMQMFLFAFYIWTWMLFQLTRVLNNILGLILIYVPNYLTPSNITQCLNSNIPVQIVKAFDDNGNDITEKLKLFMNFKWDRDMCDDKGGIDLDTFLNYLNTSFIWISYIMKYDINIISYLNFTDFVSNMGEDGLGKVGKIDELKKCIQMMVVNTSKKIIHRLKENKEASRSDDLFSIEIDDIVFGEVEF